MAVVVDASVVVKTAIPEPESDLADALLERSGVLAPDLVVAEVANAVWRRVRTTGASIELAQLTLDRLAAGEFDLAPTPPLVTAALDLALLTGATVYDCVYLAQALRDGAILVTADERFVQAVKPHHPDAIVLLRDT